MAKKIDALLHAEIVETVRNAMEVYNEEWLDEDHLIERFQMFTKEWLKRYGKSLPRTYAEVIDENGVKHRTQKFSYPAHKIARMIESNEIKHLRCLCVRAV